MPIDQFFWEVLKSFIALFIILDPFLGLAIFIPLTRNMDKTEKAKQAFLAVSVAFILLIIFLFLGKVMLNILGISFSSFVVAGGIMLLILAIQELFGIEFSKKSHNRKVAAVIIGTPLLCGPGAITTIIILSQHYGYWPPILASVFALSITWVMLLYSERIFKLLGERIVEVFSRILGLVLAALAAEFIKEGIISMIEEFKLKK